MNDLIDRRAAIDAVKNTDVVVLYHDTEPVEEAIEEAIEATKRSITTGIEGLPSAQPEPCDFCKHQADCGDMALYCPAERKEGEEAV
jgi:hypothetical protein